MTDIDTAYNRILERARGRDLQSGICQTFLFGCSTSYVVYGGLAPTTIARLDPILQDAVFVVLCHLCINDWRPDTREIKRLREQEVGFWWS